MSISKLLALQELRELSDLHSKAAVLHLKFHISQRAIASALGMHQSSVVRAVSAERKGRSPGARGRPRLLNEEEESSLVNKIKLRADALNAMDKHEILEEVRQ